MACLFPHASLSSALNLVSDTVPGIEVTAVYEAHPATRADWCHERDLPFSRELYEAGEVDFVTEAWVVFRNID
eukprot:5922304-Prorocentrum_lima.AAC.1